MGSKFGTHLFLLKQSLTQQVCHQNRAHSQSCGCTSSSCSRERASDTDEDRSLQDAQLLLGDTDSGLEVTTVLVDGVDLFHRN